VYSFYSDDSLFVPLKPVIEEWSANSSLDRAKVLWNLWRYGSKRVVLHLAAFRSRSSGVYHGHHLLSPIAAALAAASPTVRGDGEAALADVLVSAEALRDFCRVTATRPPDIALGRASRLEWLFAQNPAPPSREPTAAEVEAAEKIRLARQEKAEELRARGKSWERGRIAVLSRARRPGAPQPRPGSSGESPRAANDGGVPSAEKPIPAQPGGVRRGATPVAKYEGYRQQDQKLAERVAEMMASGCYGSSWAALLAIPDADLPGSGTAESRRKRIHRRIPKTGNG
jgi:hypothetical protein